MAKGKNKKKEFSGYDLLSILALIISFLSLTVVAIPSSPKIYYFSNLNFKDIYCLPELNDLTGTDLSIGFTNTGKNPTRMNFQIEGNNIEIGEGKIGRSGEISFLYKNNLSFLTNILPYDADKDIRKYYVIKVLNSSVNRTSIKLRYEYKTYLWNLIPFIKQIKKQPISNCYYVLNESLSLGDRNVWSNVR